MSKGSVIGTGPAQSVRHRSPMTARGARPDGPENGLSAARPQEHKGLTPPAFTPTTRASWRPERPPETFRDPWQGLALSRLFLSGRGRPRSEEGAVPQRSTSTRGREDQAP